MHVWAGAAIAMLVVGLVGWLILSPGWAVGLAQEQVRLQLGRTLEVKGGAHLELSPLSIRLDEVSMDAGEGPEGAFLIAQSIRVPITLGQFLTRSADLTRLRVEGAEVAFLIDDRGQASWSFPDIKTPGALRIEIARSSLRYFDARNGQALVLTGVNGAASTDAEGGLTLNGTAEISGRLARIEASLKSLARVHADGSPFDLAVETPEGSVSFNGRLSTAKVLSLAGSASAASPDLRSAARWMGLTIEDGASFKQVSIEGVLDSAGRAIAFRNANAAVDQASFTGEIVFDFRNEVPKLQAALAAPSFMLDSFLPQSGSKPGEWGTANLGFQSLRAFDAEVTIETDALTYGALNAVPARLGASLAGGKLTSTVAVLPDPNSSIVLNTVIDSSQLPPSVAFDLKAEGIESGQLFPGLLGVDWLSGKGTVTANLAGAGQTQQEIIGTLKGKANVSLANASFKGLDLKAMLAAVGERIVEGWQGETEASTVFSTLAADFTVADGIAALGNFTLSQPELNVTMTGEADLLRRALDLRAEPKFSGAEGTATPMFPVGILIRGPWGAPRIYPDVPGLAENPAKGFEALKAMSPPSGN
jgi:uncharacterized protein involved in outer membrane biogenesis